MLNYTIFVVDDEESIRDAALLNLTEHRVLAFASAEEAIDALEDEVPDLILQDIGLPGMDGVQALETIRTSHPEILFIMITAYEDVATVVKAMKLGAYDYVVKPLHMDTLKTTIGNALASIRLRKEVWLLQQAALKENSPCFISQSNRIQSVMEFVRQVAKSPDAPVLIIGDTGTGKELVAGAIHYQSPRYRGPLVTLNCAAIPKDLVESELFGYEPGAFSGARAGGKRGLIEEAADGTLFLDEVGDLPPEAQAKLLRFLDYGEFYKVGGTKLIKARPRVISATNRDLAAMVEAGDFRRDLFFRLGLIKVEVPALNQRREDILPIARHFLLEMNRKYGRDFTGFSPEARDFLLGHTFAGNVRELKGMVERGALTAPGPELTPRDMGFSPGQPPPPAPAPAGGAPALPSLPAGGLDLDLVLRGIELKYIEHAQELAQGNETKAARLLGMNYHTFRYRKKKLVDGSGPES